MSEIYSTALSILSWQEVLMFIIGGALIYLGIAHNKEPLLLVPLGFGIILGNMPLGGLMEEGGLLKILYDFGILKLVFPPVIFLGLGTFVDFAPLLANPKTLLFGAGAHMGIFTSFYLALLFGFNIPEAAAIGIIGGADGPATLYTGSYLAPHIMGATSMAAFSYIALIPIVQPPIMRLLTNKAERMIVMKQLRHVRKREKVIFPILATIVVGIFVPLALPLVGMFMLGNLMRECGVLDRVVETFQDEVLNAVTLFLLLTIGASMNAKVFFTVQTLTILSLGLAAFAVSSASGVLFAKLMNLFLKEKINPLIGSAGIAGVPMSARVSQMVGAEANPANYLLMHAMGPNIAGVIGSMIIAGVFVGMLGR